MFPSFHQKLPMKSLQFLLTGSVLLITTGSLCAQKTSQVVVTDHGTTAPVINSGDTGNTAGLDNRFGFDQKEIHGQTFTLEKGGTLKSIFIAYNGFDRGAGTATIGIDAGNNRKWDLVETVTLESVDFSGNSATDGRDTPVYWMKWDLSAFNLELPAGTSLPRAIAR